MAQNDSGASKTEQPTPKRLRDAKEKGQVIQSKDVTQVSVTIVAFLFFVFAGKWMIETFNQLLLIPTQFLGKPFDYALHEVMMAVFGEGTKMSLIIVVLLATTAIVATIMHQGLVFSGEKLKIKMETLNPVNGAKNIFSKKNLVEVLKSIIKTSLYAAFFVYIIIKHLEDIVLTPHCGLDCLVVKTLEVLIEFAILITILGIVIALIDYLIQKQLYIKEMMMTKDEVKREHKDVEGNPEIKRRRREVHREIIEEQTDRAASSDVLVTNPTHITIGIMFKKDKTPLPIITLKAQDNEALYLREFAKERGVPVFENIPLAHALWENAEIERFIPADLFEPVAHVLSWVENMKSHS